MGALFVGIAPTPFGLPNLCTSACVETAVSQALRMRQKRRSKDSEAAFCLQFNHGEIEPAENYKSVPAEINVEVESTSPSDKIHSRGSKIDATLNPRERADYLCLTRLPE
jgi:hypothetical protein